MILKEADDRSGDVAELKRLKETSPAAFHAAIQKQIDKIYAGVAGEKEAAHFLGREFGRSDSMAILHDLRLGVDGDYAQIDHLVIHRVQQAAWVLETKNYSGRLTCDEHGDWTVWHAGKPQAIPSPVNQADRQRKMLRLWLDSNGVQTIRQIHSVVLISPHSSVNRAKLPPGAHVVKSDNFGPWWSEQVKAIGFGTALGMVGRHLLSGMSRNDLVALGEKLSRAHVPPTYDWRAMLRLPHPKHPAPHAAAEPVAVKAEAIEASGEDIPSLISTPHGDITLSRLPDGRYALRNEKNGALIEVVKTACRGRAQWSPRFRNWVADESTMKEIVAKIRDHPQARA